MKKTLLSLALVLLCCSGAFCQNSALKFIDASELNIIGKPFPNTPCVYQRVDTTMFKGFTTTENNQLRCPVGMAVLFRTDSRSIVISSKWGYVYGGVSTTAVSYRGFDLYIRDAKGEWTNAASGAPSGSDLTSPGNLKLITDMDGTFHDCMLYLPMYSELKECRIGVDSGASIEPLESPFRHRIVVYGSSFTQGVSTSRSGMSWPMQFMRRNGLQVVSMAASGRCMMQPYYTDVLEKIEADAFIFDTFSNPNDSLIRARLMPFIDRLIAAHPGKPLIFQRTIYREGRNFNTAVEERERAKAEAVEEMFAKMKSTKEGREKYRDVYLITPNASERHETSVDGTHPDDYGYTLWCRSIEKPVLRILKKYGIR